MIHTDCSLPWMGRGWVAVFSYLRRALWVKPYPGVAVPSHSMPMGLVVATATGAVAMASPEMAMEEAPVAVTNRQPKDCYPNR